MRTGQRTETGFIFFLVHSFTRLNSHGFISPDTTATVSCTKQHSHAPKPGFLLPDARATVSYHQKSKPRLYITNRHSHGFVHPTTQSCFQLPDINATVSYRQTPQPWVYPYHGFIHQTPKPRFHSPDTTAMVSFTRHHSHGLIHQIRQPRLFHQTRQSRLHSPAKGPGVLRGKRPKILRNTSPGVLRSASHGFFRRRSLSKSLVIQWQRLGMQVKQNSPGC